MTFSPDGYTSSANKWSKKLTGFPISSKKKKSTLASEEQLFFSPIHRATAPIKSAPVTPVQYGDSYPLRFSSMPRPNTGGRYRNDDYPARAAFSDILSPTPINSDIQKDNTSHRSNKKKSLINLKCSICNESISNRGNGERIIELKCGHICHNDCLLVSFQDSSPDIATVPERFPFCVQCKAETARNVNCIPKDSIIEETLLSSFFINNFETPTAIESALPNDVFPAISTPVNPNPISENLNTLKNVTAGNNGGPYEYQKDDVIQINPHDIKIPIIETPAAQHVQHSIPMEVVKPSLSDMKSPTHIGIPVRSYKRQVGVSSNVEPLAVIVHSFVDFIRHRLPVSLSTSQFNSEFGSLRIVDWLKISTGTSMFEICCCFLFTKRLLIAFTDDSPEQVSSKELNEIDFKSFAIYSLEECSLKTTSSSVFEITMIDSNRSSTLYISELWDNKNNVVSHKWISAILNPTLELDSTSFTSTIPLSAIIPEEKSVDLKSNENATENIAGTTDEKYLSLETPPLNIGKENAYLDVGTANSKRVSAFSQLTSISSIISMKQKRPSRIIIVLQIDGEKLKFQNMAAVIYNTLVALSLSFKSMYVFFIDSQRNIFQEGLFAGIFKCANDFKLMTVNPYNDIFDVKEVEKRLHDYATVENTGIVFCSGTLFDRDNILTVSTDSLKRSNQQRNNILKIKIGYMNVESSSQPTDLIEIDDWNNLLEIICYTYSISFEEDERDSYCPSEIVKKELPLDNDQDSIDSESENSLLTLNISNGIL